MSKKLLIISYHFPPDSAIGAVRPEKFAKYLPNFGWQAEILTTLQKNYTHIDSSFNENNKNYKTHRTRMLPTVRDIYFSFKGLIKRFKPIKNHDWNPPWTPPSQTSNREKLISKFKRYFQSCLIWLPDDKNGLILPGIIRGLYIIKKNRIDAIYTTSPPNSDHLIGLFLKKITGKPWIADFRDPWDWSTKPFFVRSKFSDYLEKKMLEATVKNCDKLISVTEEMTETFKHTYKTEDKFTTIINGYDPEDFEQVKNETKFDKFTFTYAGQFYLKRNPETFLNALSELISEKKISKQDVQVRFIGNCKYLYNLSIEQIASNYSLDDVVLFIDPLPRDEVYKEMARSHTLLLFASEQPLQIPGKLFEYMGLESIILSVCDEGATKNILQYYTKSVLVPPDNLQEMKKAILKCMQLNNSTKEQEKELEEFSWCKKDFLTQRLTTTLENILK